MAAERFAATIQDALGSPADRMALAFAGTGALPSAFRGDRSGGRLHRARRGWPLADLVGTRARRHRRPAPRLAVVRAPRSGPIGWALPAPWDPVAGDYRTPTAGSGSTPTPRTTARRPSGCSARRPTAPAWPQRRRRLGQGGAGGGDRGARAAAPPRCAIARRVGGASRRARRWRPSRWSPAIRPAPAPLALGAAPDRPLAGPAGARPDPGARRPGRHAIPRRLRRRRAARSTRPTGTSRPSSRR